MPNLSHVTIDAGVLAVPCINCTKDTAYQYVTTLLDWSQLLDEPWIAIYMSERASESLIADDLFPLRDHLKKLFNAHGIVEYDVNTVAKIVSQLLAITPSFETYYRVSDFLADNLKTNPDVICLTTCNGLQSDLARCILLLAILRKHCSQPFGAHSFILKKTPKRIVQVKAQIHEIEHLRDDISDLPYHPDFFVGEVLVCDDFKGLIDCLDESSILIGADDDDGVELAIRIGLFKIAFAQGDSPVWGDIVTPTIGQQFRKSCQQVCAEQGDSAPSKIIRAIVESSNGSNLSAVHALRAGAGGNDPQKMRGNDKAQRRDIDRELHLHYWLLPNGLIELASVVYHNDFSIPE